MNNELVLPSNFHYSLNLGQLNCNDSHDDAADADADDDDAF